MFHRANPRARDVVHLQAPLLAADQGAPSKPGEDELGGPTPPSSGFDPFAVVPAQAAAQAQPGMMVTAEVLRLFRGWLGLGWCSMSLDVARITMQLGRLLRIH